jgi:predicted GIY-YIG superfamily endonuclease
VYIVTNRPNGTLYTGVTSNLARRIWEHREGVVDGFTKQYGLKRLVYAENPRGHSHRNSARAQHETLAATLGGAPDPRGEPQLG